MLESEIEQHFAEMDPVKINWGVFGFTLVFPNGYELSVQRSEFHHCGEDTAEIAAFDPEGEFLWPEQVRGWQTSEMIVEAIKDVGTR